MALALIGEKLKRIYGRWSVLIDPVFKFALAAAAFFLIRRATGFHPAFSHPALLLILALIASLVNSGFIVMCCGVLIAGQAFGISTEAGAFTTAFIAVLLIVFIRYVPGESVFAVLTALGFFAGLPPLIPVVAAVRRGASCVFSVVTGCFAFYLIRMLRTLAPELAASESTDMTERIVRIGTAISAPEMYSAAMACAAAFLFTWLISRRAIDHAPELSLLGGCVVYPVVFFGGSILTGVWFEPLPVVIGCAVSALLALVLQAMVLPLNFRRSQYLHFEDDDYYYYVKVVPRLLSEVNEEPYSEFPQFDEPLVPAPRMKRDSIDQEELSRRIEGSLEDL